MVKSHLHLPAYLCAVLQLPFKNQRQNKVQTKIKSGNLCPCTQINIFYFINISRTAFRFGCSYTWTVWTEPQWPYDTPQLFPAVKAFPENHLLHLIGEKMYSHRLLHTCAPLLPQKQCDGPQWSKSQHGGICLCCAHFLSALRRLPSCLPDGSHRLKKLASASKAESVPWPPCELTTFLALGLV